MTTPANQEEQLATLVAANEIEVAHQDGRKELVRIRKVPIRSMDRLAKVWGQPAKEVAVYADKDSAWVESLTDDSFEAVMEGGRGLNFSSFRKWYRWAEQSLEAVGQDVAKLIPGSGKSSNT